MARTRFRLSFDLLEVSAVALLAALAGLWYRTRPPLHHVEAIPLAERYGREERRTAGYEEWIVRDFFGDQRGGVFVDIGAATPKWHSNTWWLETQQGWSGIAVDAIQEYGAAYAAERPRTRFRSYFVSDRSGELVPFTYVPELSLVSSADEAFAKDFGKETVTRHVPTITLTELLDREGIGRLDFLTIDIELAEPKALAGFDIERFRPRLVCIEAHAETRQFILDYFASHGYVLVGQYLRIDPLNVYFRPLTAAAPDGLAAAASGVVAGSASRGRK